MEMENGVHAKGNVVANGHAANGLCIKSDPLNWGAAAEELKGSHLEEVKKMVEEFWRPLVRLEGAPIKISQVAVVTMGVAAEKDTVEVELSESTREGVRANS
ncbi:hypothetical protein Cni_G03995 [Canna indica]|uniref:Phenylalanine ammonia-lyase n=1 Tax=Canna indica TaxID=4628 RepID=A0AAQ3Q2B9_9LILI|nr:hypothetical protein Cni_G03995 [Canna indica]